ncbi:hypothetical protein [Bordetella sp. LUAb4]|uniref:hypothetical protein n=1 Tax=Bordetella sp. LUAb4 TaxID=2843195 RepID=UPI001E361839|nr:hypothetical protein [Bordetella sp. LUAb4]
MFGQASLTTSTPQFNPAHFTSTPTPTPGATYYIAGIPATSYNQGTVEKAAQYAFKSDCTRKQFDPRTSELAFVPCEGNGKSRPARAYRPMRPRRPWVQPQVASTHAIRGIPQENIKPGELRAMSQDLYGPSLAPVVEKPSEHNQGFTSTADLTRASRGPTGCEQGKDATVQKGSDGTCWKMEETKLDHCEMVTVPCERDVTEAGAGSSTAPTDEASDVTQADAEISTTQAGAEDAVTQTSKKRNVPPADGGILERAPEAQAGWSTVVPLFFMALGVGSIFFLFMYCLLANRGQGQSEQKQDEEAQRNARPLLDPQYV